jgi:hypothetical protein
MQHQCLHRRARRPVRATLVVIQRASVFAPFETEEAQGEPRSCGSQPAHQSLSNRRQSLSNRRLPRRVRLCTAHQSSL